MSKFKYPRIPNKTDAFNIVASGVKLGTIVRRESDGRWIAKLPRIRQEYVARTVESAISWVETFTAKEAYNDSSDLS